MADALLRRMPVRSRALVVALLVTASCAVEPAERETASASSGERRVMIGYAPGAKARVKAKLANGRGRTHRDLDAFDTVAASLPEAEIAELEADPDVLYVEDDAPRR